MLCAVHLDPVTRKDEVDEELLIGLGALFDSATDLFDDRVVCLAFGCVVYPVRVLFGKSHLTKQPLEIITFSLCLVNVAVSLLNWKSLTVSLPTSVKVADGEQNCNHFVILELS